MGIELLPQDNKYPREYHVRKNHCRNPHEDCFCYPWAVFDANGNKIETFFDKKKAEYVANAMNNDAER